MFLPCTDHVQSRVQRRNSDLRRRAVGFGAASALGNDGDPKQRRRDGIRTDAVENAFERGPQWLTLLQSSFFGRLSVRPLTQVAGRAFKPCSMSE